MSSMRKPKDLSKRRQSPKLDAWRKSPEFRAIAREATKKAQAAYRKAPKCGARAKSTGSPCRQPALENGRCHFHGGRTPKGRDWHVRQAPLPGPNALARLETKESHFKRRDRQRQIAEAQMTERQRAEREEWRKAHRPGHPAQRARARQDRKVAAELAELMKEEDYDDIFR